jgi:hypothetical protein
LKKSIPATNKLSPKESMPPHQTDAAHGVSNYFGTGINKHPVEFSNNQHTPSTARICGWSQGQLFYLTRKSRLVKT